MLQRPTFKDNFGKRKARTLTSSILAISLFALGFIGVAAGPAAAADVQGGASFSFGYGVAAKALKKSGVSITSIAPGTHTRFSRERVRVNLPATSVGEGSILTGGGIRFSLRKRTLLVRNLTLAYSSTRISTVTGMVGGRQIRLFTTPAPLSADSLGVAVSLPSGQLTLVLEAAKRIQSSLRSGPISPGTIGGMSAYVTEPFEDPSLEICGIGAATRSFGEVPLAAPSPILVGPTVSPVESAITWGIKSSLNGYVNGFSRPLGLGGATVNPVPGPPNPQIPPRNYTFVATPGQYASNSAETGFDDQAVVNSTGGVMYCNTAHGFRITISNPTVVIDGSASRIIADVDTNLSGNPASGVGDWMPTQRVDLARLDLSGVPAVESGAAVTWSAVPARLTQEGSDALRLCEVNVPGAPPNCLYPAGTVLDPITVAVLIEPS